MSRMPLLRHARATRATIFVALLALLALVAGCGVLTPPEPATYQADAVNDLYLLIFGIAIVIFVVVEGLIVWSVVRYRRRDERLPSQFHGNTMLEIVWTAIPTVIVLVIFVLSLGALATVEQRTPDPPVTIVAEGFQWQWRFSYRDGDDDPENDPSTVGTEANPAVMGVPVGEPVLVILDSNDVVHSFFVPQFLIKRDVNPYPTGVPDNTLEFTVKEPGEYSGQCAEFCGFGHNAMRFVVRAMPRAEYDAWLAELEGGSGPAGGESACAPASAQPSAAASGAESPVASGASAVASPEGSGSAFPGASAGASPAAPTTLTLSAQDIQFSTDQLCAPAGQPLTLTFENLDDGVDHNVSISREGRDVFTGEVFAGPGVREYSIPALQPGQYEFRCDVHPEAMRGTLTVQ
ncbi:MAG: cytochrome c oxidase subunit II [Candidatus Limnocylindria bacterium]